MLALLLAAVSVPSSSFLPLPLYPLVFLSWPSSSQQPAARHVLPRFISVSASRAQFLHLNGKKLWEICKRGVLLGLCQPVKSSKHDVRCLIYFFLSLSVSLFLSLSFFLVALSCTIFYIFMHDAFNHVMHMIFRRTSLTSSHLPAVLLWCIQFHQHELCLP